MHTVGKDREKIPYYALFLNSSARSLYVEVQCVQNWVKNELVKSAKCCQKNMVKRDTSPFQQNGRKF